MSDSTAIEYADASWPVVAGCDHVSPGCDNCYAARLTSGRLKHLPAYTGLAEGARFNGQVRMLEDRLAWPLRWRKPRRIFVSDMADLFHEKVTADFIADVFAVMALTPQHTYMVFTKRHARMRALLNSEDFWYQVGRKARHLGYAYDSGANHLSDGRNIYSTAVWKTLRYLPNVWLMVSVENQQWADIRIPALLETPAAVRGISAEPLLGPIDLGGRGWLPMSDNDPDPDAECITCGTEEFSDQDGHDVIHYCGKSCSDTTENGCGREGETTGAWCDGPIRPYPRLGWVIAGGESGPGARPVHPNWVRSIRDQCTAARVPFFHKQWGAWGPAPFVVRVCDPKAGWQGTEEELEAAKRDAEARGATHVHTGNPYRDDDGQIAYYVHEIGHKPWSLERAELPGDHLAPIRHWGKKRAGRTLDGQTWDQYPAVTS